MQTERTVMSSEDSRDPLGGQNLRKGKSLARQKRIDNFLKTAAAWAWRIWYSSRHEKTLPGFSRQRATKEGFQLVPRLGKKRNIALAGGSSTKITPSVQAQLARLCKPDSAIRS
jgi:hypothetical protein